MSSLKKIISSSLLTIITSISLSCASNTPDFPNNRLNERLIEERKQNNKSDNYALIICGSAEERFTVDSAAIYQTLLRRGFKEKNIFVLDEHGTEQFLYPSDGKSTLSNITNAFYFLSKCIDKKDTFVVHIDDHGSRAWQIVRENAIAHHEASLSGREHLSESKLVEFLSEIHPKRGIVTVDTCYAGGMIAHLPKEYVGVAGTEEDYQGFSRTRDSFGGFFYLAWCDKKADTNEDGKISLKEAVDYAKERHTWSKKGITNPVIKSEKNPNKIYVP